MRGRTRDRRYRDGVDKGRMSTQNITLPIKKDFKPQPEQKPISGISVIVNINGVDTKTIPYETLPKQIQRHILSKIQMEGKKTKK